MSAPLKWTTPAEDRAFERAAETKQEFVVCSRPLKLIDRNVFDS